MRKILTVYIYIYAHTLPFKSLVSVRFIDLLCPLKLHLFDKKTTTTTKNSHIVKY